MKKFKPEVSVMMPTFNTIKHLDGAVLSILSQAHKNWELLGYDDGSDDGTFERMQFWEEQDERIKAVKPFAEHGQYIDLCNQMLADAQGEFVARMDADDISLPNRLSTQIDFMKRKQNAILLGGMCLSIIEAEGDKLTDQYPWEANIIKPVASRDVPVNQDIRTHHRIVHGTMLTRKDELEAAGGYDDLSPIEDWDVSLKMAERGDVYVLPDVMYLRRIHNANNSKGHPNKQRAFQAIKDRYDLDIKDLPRSRPANL